MYNVLSGIAMCDRLGSSGGGRRVRLARGQTRDSSGGGRRFFLARGQSGTRQWRASHVARRQ